MSEEEIKKPLTKEDLGFIRELIYAEKVFDMSFQNIAKKLLNEVDLKETQLQQKENIIKEVREYITSYESIETIQQFDHNKNNKDLDYSTIDEMTRRYMIVHDKVLEILDKENKNDK